jgi:hypothetical protein
VPKILSIYLVAVANCSSASAQPVARVIGLPLPEARATLLAEGWKPIESTRRMADGTLEMEFGDANVVRKAGYIEVEWCSGTGRNYCRFGYRRRLECLALVTTGEWHPPEGVPRVERVEHACR